MNPITISAVVKADIATVWEFWTDPSHITQWAFASDDWECPRAENDIRTGGAFSSTMAAKDGSASFDFGGTYTNVIAHELIEYTMGDGRKSSISFTPTEAGVEIVQSFDPENENTRELQQAGWQSILDNFKKHVEASKL